ncbi:hypothetical protein IQ272_23450 [Chroococcidiopsidales cyanobacterium LEGE 13417]|nr:hypothetical protein [Chroococcidiopsidales cyanobacterium LEGE 13417]
MLQDEKFVTLYLRSRPLRLAYLVTCLDDLKDAVNLYSHTWGGAANALLPVTDDEEKTQQLRNSLTKFDPDYILSTAGKCIPSTVKYILDSYPARHYSIQQECIYEFVNNEESIDLHIGNLSSSHRVKMPHIVPVLNSLYSGRVSDIGIHIVESPSSEFDLELSLQAGIISQSYRKNLIQYLGAKVLKNPQNAESFFQISLGLSTSLNPALLTLQNTKKQYKGDLFNSGWLNEPYALCLFLHEKENLDIATSFWNIRWFLPLNKLLIPKQAFVEKIEYFAELFLLIMPSIEAVYIAVHMLEKHEAEILCSNVKNVVSRVAGREIKVWLSYKNFYSEIRKVSIYTGSQKISSQRLHSDGSVRFLPEIPSGLEMEEFAFGYDAELHSEAGKRLLFPKSSAITTLLSNSLDRIEYYDKEKIGFPSLSLRSTDIGIAGIATTGRECRLYIHPDSAIISKHLKSSVEIEIKANRYTRYAEGFIKILGGIEKIYSLIYKGGIETLLALCSKNSAQSGQDTASLANFIRDRVQIEHKKALFIINTQLPELLKSGLVRRGISLKCPTCDLETWYPISLLDEFIKCQGCFEKFQLENLKKHEYSYMPNELSRRLIDNGGIAVLATASLFLTSYPPSFIQFGGDLFEPSQPNNFAEIDLIAIAGEICAIAECKYFPKLDSEEQVTKALSSSDGLERAIKVAERIGAKIVLLGVSTNLEASDHNIVESLKKGVAGLRENAQAKGIGVDLWLTGSGVNRDPFTAINLENLILKDTEHESNYIYERGVGELPCSYFIGAVKPFNEETLRTWKHQLLS